MAWPSKPLALLKTSRFLFWLWRTSCENPRIVLVVKLHRHGGNCWSPSAEELSLRFLVQLWADQCWSTWTAETSTGLPHHPTSSAISSAFLLINSSFLIIRSIEMSSSLSAIKLKCSVLRRVWRLCSRNSSGWLAAGWNSTITRCFINPVNYQNIDVYIYMCIHIYIYICIYK